MPRAHRIAIRLNDEDEHARLAACAADEGMTISAWMRRAGLREAERQAALAADRRQAAVFSARPRGKP